MYVERDLAQWTGLNQLPPSFSVLVSPDFMRDCREFVPACLLLMSVARFCVVLDCHAMVYLQRDCCVSSFAVFFEEVCQQYQLSFCGSKQ